ncbi:hypothetical protein [Hydrogenophaga intermedia]|uniref:Uncharacterized protein n=1 Tax=Hydrogenophaga intermedia TaxID=65786 RepID=A0A1L1PIA6_HYDIT|nr:hypothetical protein [Hydrogenophaga intermedia]TMU72434.1 hypothetical protein FGJ01_18850 [Hydrogenophaga intermedia]CDN87489.1 hypothetical protein BN948_01911 [Hydrogenophaga intermedia]
MNVYELKRKALGHHCPCIGGSSKSANTSEDNRVTAGSVGISGAGNAVQITDGGLVSRGLDTVDLSIANLGEGYADLIDAAHNIFTQGQSLIGQTQKSVADAYAQAEADKSGALDQRTIIVLAVVVAVVAGFYFVNRKG